MPELPEVETTRLSLAPYLKDQRIHSVLIRNPRLRWPIPATLPKILPGLQINDVTRRAKYLLLDCGAGTLILHLGMSGSLRIFSKDTPAQKHDHFDLRLENGSLMRLNDPRRFGAVLWETGDVHSHSLLKMLGPEPLTEDFSARGLHQSTRNRSMNIKQVLMDSHTVAGVGNIYANEALFRAGIKPQTPAMRLSLARLEKLVEAVRETLQLALIAGGSTLRNFVDGTGKPGYFQQSYFVYGRDNLPCLICASPIRLLRHAQRATFYCTKCQR